MARKAGGRNLFALDQGSIESTLAEANASLMRRRDDLLKDFDKLPGRLETEAEIEAARAFADELEDLLAEAKKARLSDGRPFAEAGKLIKSFFARIEGPLKSMLEEVVDRVTDVGLRQLEQVADEEDLDDDDAEEDADPLPSPAIRATGGAPIISKATASTQIAMAWIVSEVDQQTVNLEELRRFFTESALLAACRRHLEENGPHRLKGVTYEQVADI
jgi:hypothetical protein